MSIKPIELTQTIIQGSSKAVVTIFNDGLKVNFEKSTPEFMAKVGNFVDEFVYSDKIAKTQESLTQFAIDTFEKVK